MAIVNVRDIRIIEGNSSFQFAQFELFLDAPATAPVTVTYYFQDGSAEAAFDDYDSDARTVTFPAGTSTLTVQTEVYGDTLIEGNETFDLVVVARQNATLAGNAAALVATATIYDNDDGLADPAPGTGALARQLDGPASSSGTLPTLSVRDVAQVEGDSGFEFARFLVTLDRPATADVTFSYYFQDGTAGASLDDYDGEARTVTIAAGQQSTWVQTEIYGDNVVEANETFDIVIIDPFNAVLPNNAPVITATATIIDDDGGAPNMDGGIGNFADELAPPPSAGGTLPTISVRDVSIIEGDSGFEFARFLIVLDRPATAEVSGSYYFQDGSAAASLDDYDNDSGTFRIGAGQRSTWVQTEVFGDNLIEGDETFDIVLVNPTNGVFTNNAPALIATATISGDDGGNSSAGGIGSYADEVPGPVAQPGLLPTVSIRDVAIVEGDSGFEFARFLITLDRPAPADISLLYSFNDGSASAALGDYDGDSRRITIAAGQESTWISTEVFGDNLIEGDETFTVALSGIVNGVFENGAPILEATATVIDDDGGPLAQPGGVGDPARGVVPPDAGPGGSLRLDVVDVSVAEGDSGSEFAYVYVMLSAPPTNTVSVRFDTVDGTAIENVDYDDAGGTLTFGPGQQSSYVAIRIYGDQTIEGDEAFTLRFSNPSGVGFAGGGATLDATVLIRDNEAGTAGSPDTGPDFTYLPDPFVIDGTSGNDDLVGTSADETLNGFAGNDRLTGNGGADLLNGGTGNDIYVIDGLDTVNEVGGGGFDRVVSSATVNLLSDRFAGNIESIALTNGAGAANLTGNGARNTLVGNSSANRLDGRSNADIMRGGDGNDTYVVDNVLDRVLEDGTNGFDRVLSTVNVDLTNSFRFSGDVEGASLTLGAGDANLFGNGLNNILIGSGGNNRLDGRGGNDTMRGGAGNDVYVWETGDIVDEASLGGSGRDRVVSGETVNLTNTSVFRGAVEDITLSGTGVANGFGNGFANDIQGNGGANRLNGFDGLDSLRGFGGNDVLNGGARNDRLTGDGGADTFVFNSALANNNIDTITDFTSGVDTLLLDDAVFAGLAPGSLTANRFHVAGTAGFDADVRIIYNAGNGVLSYDADGSGAGAAQVFAVLSSTPTIDETDFVVV